MKGRGLREMCGAVGGVVQGQTGKAEIARELVGKTLDAIVEEVFLEPDDGNAGIINDIDLDRLLVIGAEMAKDDAEAESNSLASN